MFVNNFIVDFKIFLSSEKHKSTSFAESVISNSAVDKTLYGGVGHVCVDSRQGGVASEAVAHQSHQEILVRTVVIADQGSSSLSPTRVFPGLSSSTHLARLRLPPADSLLFKCGPQSPSTFLP